MAIKTRRITCAHCGQRETILRGERGPVTAYCDVCREERKRDQARNRSHDEVKRVIDRDVKPRWDGCLMSSITRRDVLAGIA